MLYFFKSYEFDAIIFFSDPRWQINTPSSRGKPSQNFYSIVLIAKGRTLWSRMEEVVVQEGSEDLQK